MLSPQLRYGLVLGGALAALAAGYWLLRASRVYSREVQEFSEDRAVDPDIDGDLPERVEWELAGSGRQRAWILPSEGARFVIVVHGSPGTGLGLHEFGRGLAESGFGVLLLDLPGYGGSDGERRWGTEFRRAIRAAVDFLIDERGAIQVFGIGYSMGTCVLAQAASEDPRIERLVLLAPFTRLSDQLRYQFRSRIPGLASVAIRAAASCGVRVADLDTLAAAKSMHRRPIFLVAGERDTIVPTSMAGELRDVLPQGRVWVVPGAGHGTLVDEGGAALIRRVATFLAE